MNNNVKFHAIEEAALQDCPELLFRILPGGRIDGNEFVAASVNGGEGDSFKFNISNGSRRGLWCEFNSDGYEKQSGWGVGAIIALQNHCSIGDAGINLAKMIGYPLDEHTSPINKNFSQQKKPAGDYPYAAVIPVPDDVKIPTEKEIMQICKQRQPPHHVAWFYSLEGKLLILRARFESNGKKIIFPITYREDGHWINKGTLPQPYSWYGLDGLSQENITEQILILVEGELKANLLQNQFLETFPNGKIKIVVLSLYNGITSAKNMDYAILSGRNVKYWPDADKGGIEAAFVVYNECQKHNVNFKGFIIPPENVPPKWDAGDAVESGMPIEELKDLIENSQPIEVFEKIVKNRWPDAINRRYSNYIEIGNPLNEYDESEEQKGLQYLPTPPNVPLNAFTQQIQDLLVETSEAFCVPLQIPTACFLSLISSLVGRTRCIKFKKSWTAYANLWIAIVAKSGVGKSPVMNAYFESLRRHESESNKINQDLYEKFLINKSAYEMQQHEIARLQSKGKTLADNIPIIEKPAEPIERQIIIDDITIEAIINILLHNPKGLLWLTDEFARLICDLDRYSLNKGGTKERMLSMHDSGPIRSNRISRNSLYIPHATLSILGGIQPELLPTIFKGGANGEDAKSGFIPRILFMRAVQEKPSLWTENTLSAKSICLLENLTRNLWTWDIEFQSDGKEIEKTITPTREAKEVFVDWFNEISKLSFVGNGDAILEKLKDHAMRLILTLHCLNAAISGNDGLYPVDAGCVERGLLLADMFKEQQAQCWRLLEPTEKIKQPDPVERVIIEVCVELKTRIAEFENRIPSKELFAAINAKLPSELTGTRLGRICEKMGLVGGRMKNGERARIIPRDRMKIFDKLVQNLTS